MASERIHVYELADALARGGPGRVHLGRVAESGGPLDPGTPIVLRTVAIDEVEDEKVLSRLVEIHSSARRIDSPRVLAPVDHGLSTGPAGRQFWSVSRRIEGRTLAELTNGIDYLPDMLTEAFLRHAAEGLAAIHAAGVCGIGLAPTSILMTADGSGVLTDPGFGPAVGPRWPAGGKPPASMMCASPEILSGASPDPRDDLYALGAILFRAMTGAWHRPEDARALLLHAAEMDAERPNDMRPKCSLFLSEVAFALLRSERAARIRSAGELIGILTDRRKSAWWHDLHIDQDTHDDDATGRRPIGSEPPPPAIPEPAPPPSEGWWTQRDSLPAAIQPHAARCVGRDAEIALLVDAALRLAEPSVRVVLLEGEAGSGKTRILDAFFDRLREMPSHRVPILMYGEHRRVGLGRPLGGFTEALTRWLHGHRVIDAHDVAPLLGESAGIAAAFAAALSSDAPPAAVPQLAKEALGPVYLRCLRTIAGRAPVVLVVENLQWADPEVLDLFRFIVRAGSDLPVLLVGTHRPAAPDSALAEFLGVLRSGANLREIRVAALDAARLGQVSREFAGPAGAAGEVAARVHASCGGNAGALAEVYAALEAEEAIRRGEDGRLVVPQPASLPALPPSMADAVRRRVAALPPKARTLLAAASVQGVAFDAEVARISCGFDARTAGIALDELSRRRLVTGDGVARRFASHVLFDQVLASLDDAALAARHEATAAAFLESRNPDQLPPSRIHGILSYRVAWHYMLSGRGARGLLYVPAAIGHLRGTHRHGDGERLTALAARTMANDASRGAELVDTLLERARFLAAQGRHAEQREVLADAVLRARERRDLLRESRVLFEQAKANRALGDAAAADGDARQALACAHRAGEADVELRVHVWMAQTASREGRWQDARTYFCEALELARRRSDAVSEAEVQHGLGLVSQAVGAFDQAEEELLTALRSHRARNDLPREAETLANLGSVAAATGDLVRAEGCLRRALAIHVGLGDGGGETRVLGLLAMVLQDGGCLGEALEAHRASLDRARRLDSRTSEVVALLNLATVSSCLGRVDEARDAYGEAMRAARVLGDPRLQGYALTGLGEVARQRGSWDVAKDLLGRATDQFRATQDPSGLAAALLAAGRVSMFSGDPDEARSLLTEAHRLAEQQNARQVSVLTHSMLALLSARRGDAADAERRVAESGLAVSEIRTGDATRVEMLFLHSLVLRVLGHPDEADRRLWQAEATLVESSRGLPDSDRESVFAKLSPCREILAGAEAARARRPVPSPARTDTVAV